MLKIKTVTWNVSMKNMTRGWIHILHIMEKKKWDEIKFLKRLETTYNYINIYIVAVEQLKLK